MGLQGEWECPKCGGGNYKTLTCRGCGHTILSDDPIIKGNRTLGPINIKSWLLAKSNILHEHGEWTLMKLLSIERQTEKAILATIYVPHLGAKQIWLPKSQIEYDPVAPVGDQFEEVWSCKCGLKKVFKKNGEMPEGIWKCPRCNDEYEFGT